MPYKDLDKRRLCNEISLDNYNYMYAQQKGLYAICHKSETSIYKGKIRALCIDHDHQTFQIRGLLCNKCNKALGLFDDNVSLLEGAIKYLQLSKKIYIEGTKI